MAVLARQCLIVVLGLLGLVESPDESQSQERGAVVDAARELRARIDNKTQESGERTTALIKTLMDSNAVVADDFRSWVTDPNPDVRFHAALFLSRLKSPEAFELTLRLLSDDESQEPVARRAIEGLYDHRSGSEMRETLARSSNGPRVLLQALNRWPSNVKLLEMVMCSPDVDVARLYLRTFALREGARKPGFAKLASADPASSITFAYDLCMAELDDQRALERALTTIRARSSGDIVLAVKSCRYIQRAEVIREMLKLLGDETPCRQLMTHTEVRERTCDFVGVQLFRAFEPFFDGPSAAAIRSSIRDGSILPVELTPDQIENIRSVISELLIQREKK